MWMTCEEQNGGGYGVKKYFIVSLCKNGILGGGIVADSEAITYHTGKITIPDKYRKIEMKYKDIVSMTVGWLFILPTVTLKMNSGEDYRFVVFSRKRFVNTLKAMGVSE